MAEKQVQWTKEMYKICCEKYISFVKGNYDKTGADRSVVIKDIIEKIKDVLDVTISKNEDVDQKLKEIQVLINTYYPIYKEPVDVSYKVPEVCVSAFCEVIDEMERPKPKPVVKPEPTKPRKPIEISEPIKPRKPIETPEPIVIPQPITIEDIIKRMKFSNATFADTVVPNWSDIENGLAINHCGLGRGKVIDKTDNGITKMIKLEFFISNLETTYTNSFIYPMAFENGLLLQSDILLKRLNKE